LDALLFKKFLIVNQLMFIFQFGYTNRLQIYFYIERTRQSTCELPMKFRSPSLYLLLIFNFFFIPIHANQVVLITGASRGIGHAIADLLAKEGYTIYAGVRKDSTQEFVSNSQHHHPHFHAIEIDVTNQTSVNSAVNAIVAKEGHLDVLVNNAGIMTYGSIENVTIKEAQEMFDVNFFGVMRVTQAVLPIMRAQKKGRIIQISSRSGFRPLPSISVYAASKYALEGISETMAALLKPWNIEISLIEPGPVSTDLDFLSLYGSALTKDNDPYYSIFETAGLLDPVSPIAQDPLEIASIVKQAIEAEKPLFRYQTTESIKQQAARRLVDITGMSSIDEWNGILFPSNH
jgi:NADP-dependent 3-hydroxy acid dehydrogenase YdfG